jgi:hypothetical protein
MLLQSPYSAERPAQSYLAARVIRSGTMRGFSAPTCAMDEDATKLLHKWVREGRAEDEQLGNAD